MRAGGAGPGAVPRPGAVPGPAALRPRARAVPGVPALPVAGLNRAQTRPKCLKFAASEVGVAKSEIEKIINKLVPVLVPQYRAHVECAFKLGTSLTS